MTTYSDKELIEKYPRIEAHNGFFSIGDNVLIGAFCNLRAGGEECPITIGDNTKIAQLVTITCQSHEYRDKDVPIYQQAVINNPVTIGGDVFIGANSVILPGVSIGYGAVVGAGSVVTHNIPPYEIWFGNPARKRGERQ